MRFNLKLMLFVVMPFVAMVGTLWAIGPEPPAGRSEFMHHLMLFGVQVAWTMTFIAISAWDKRSEKRRKDKSLRP